MHKSFWKNRCTKNVADKTFSQFLKQQCNNIKSLYHFSLINSNHLENRVSVGVSVGDLWLNYSIGFLQIMSQVRVFAFELLEVLGMLRDGMNIWSIFQVFCLIWCLDSRFDVQWKGLEETVQQIGLRSHWPYPVTILSKSNDWQKQIWFTEF